LLPVRLLGLANGDTKSILGFTGSNPFQPRATPRMNIMSPLRIAFMGTPDFAVPTLKAILTAGHEVAAVYTQPPRPAGRGQAPRPSAVQAAAEAGGLPVRSPKSLRGAEEQAAFRALNLDAAVVVAYGLLLPRAILEAPRHGCYNLHPSKLPRWRGAAPLQRTVMAGDAETAVMIMRMDEGLDTGPVCLGETFPLSADETAGDLHDDCAARGARLMTQALAALAAGTLSCVAQPADGVTYAAKIDKAEARIDWRQPAATVHNQIRGLSPFPGAWFEWPAAATGAKPERVKVLRSALLLEAATAPGPPGTVTYDAEGLVIACVNGGVRLLTVQRAGRKAMPGLEFLRGLPDRPAVLPMAS
jgi:methionyl-tRNA formyltransferase